MNDKSLAGKSWVLGVVGADGSFGVLQVFDIAQHGNSADTDFWGSASVRAHDSASKARAGWQHHFSHTRPNDNLVIRMMNGDRCSPVVNKAV